MNSFTFPVMIRRKHVHLKRYSPADDGEIRYHVSDQVVIIETMHHSLKTIPGLLLLIAIYMLDLYSGK